MCVCVAIMLSASLLVAISLQSSVSVVLSSALTAQWSVPFSDSVASGGRSGAVSKLESVVTLRVPWTLVCRSHAVGSTEISRGGSGSAVLLLHVYTTDMSCIATTKVVTQRNILLENTPVELHASRLAHIDR